MNFYKIMRIERLVFKTPDGGIAYLGSGRMYLLRLYRCKFIALCFLFVLIDLDWVILWSTSTTSDLVTKGEKVRGYLAIMLFWKKKLFEILIRILFRRKICYFQDNYTEERDLYQAH